MVQRVSEKISEMTEATTMPTSSIVPFTHNGASFRATKSQLLNEYIADVSDTATGTANTTAIQACIDAARTAGGGKVRIPFVGTGVIPLTAPYRGTDGIYPGYVANDENRRANKALIIFDAENIEMYAEPGVILDRSGDAVADTTYAPYAATIYISQSSNIFLHDLELWGAQDDAELLNDVKNVTSGASIDINNGCDNIRLTNIVTQDGSDGIRIAMGRTNAESFIDPAIPPCTNIFISNFENRNNEQGLLIMRAIGVEVNGYISRTWTRLDGSTGVTQRPLYLHSCEQVNIANVDLSGAFKTCILVANYMPVTNVRISNFAIHDMMTWEEIFAIKGSYPTLSYNGTGISCQTDNCDGITFAGGSITGCATPVQYTGVGMHNVTFRDIEMRGVSSGFFANSTMWASTVLDNPMENLTLDNVKIYVEQDLVNYSTLTPQMGLYLDSFAEDGVAAVINAKNTRLRDVYVYAQNRPCRVFNSDGSVKDCHFERQTGYGSARNFEFNYSGNLTVEGVTCPVFSAPNRTQDVPTAALIRGRLTHYGDYAPEGVVVAPIGSMFYDQGGGLGVTEWVKESGVGTSSGWASKTSIYTVATLPAAADNTGRIVQVTDGGNGAWCLAYSDGSDWKRIAALNGNVATAASTLTIASGEVTVTGPEHALDTEGAAASDDLDTINGLPAGQQVVLRAVSSARTIVLKDGTGNLRLAGDFSLDNNEDRIVLRSNGSLIYEISRSDNAA